MDMQTGKHGRADANWRWAQEEFGKAALGDRRRTQRVVSTVEQLAEHPDGCVSASMQTDALRQGAYGLLASPKVSATALARAAGEAGAQRCAELDYVLVPVDGSSLSFDGTNLRHGLGAVGALAQGAQGLIVMTALAVSPQGTPLGVLAQQYWTRPFERVKVHRQKRKLEQKESGRWLDVVAAVGAAFTAARVSVKRWFQCDRAADFREMLEHVARSDDWFTVRAAQDRKVRAPLEGLLWDVVRRQPCLGHRYVQLPESPSRRARRARLAVRHAHVTVVVKNRWTKHRWTIELGVVQAREVHTTPWDEKPLEWLLWTNHPVHSLQDAERVIDGYAQRWKIEPFHRTWKSGVGVEKAQLRTAEALKKWGVMTASVAARIQRIVHLARHEPNAPATVELDPYEIKALVKLTKPRDYDPASTPTLQQVVLWLADYGGYANKYSKKRRPGPVVIARGLERIQAAAALLRELGEI